MMSTVFHLKERENIPIFALEGYFNEKAGEKINEKAEEILRNGKITLIFDFSNCSLINSQGVTAFYGIILKTIYDFNGRLFIVGADPLKTKVFQMAGIIPLVEVANDVDEAVTLSKQKKPSNLTPNE